MTERALRASEIVEFLYCRRSWWYTRNGFDSEGDQTQKVMGVQHHARHGRAVLMSGCLRSVGYLFIMAAFVSAVVYLTSLVLG